MKNSVLVVSVLLLGLSMSCKKNDDRAPIHVAIQNEPPLSFNLLNVPDNATDVDVVPTLSWESAKNPKGSEIVYDLYLDTDANPQTLYEGGVDATSFQIDDRLHLLTDYYWRVVATDSDGRTSQSATNKFSTRNLNFLENPITEAAEFSPRSRHSSAVFKEQLWVIGGRLGGANFTNDVWSSADGEQWVQATESAGFSERIGHSSVVFDNKIWVIGGFENFSWTSDVWYSDDGVTWVMANDQAEFPQRSGHRSFVFDNKIWVIGGGSLWTVYNDVWYSSDGVTWNQATQNDPFPERSGHSTFLFNDKMWVIGGVRDDALNDIWNSEDGISWVQINPTKPFPKRYNAQAIVYGDKIWLIGGRDKTQTANDIWYSNDGVDWNLASTHPMFNRHAHEAASFNDKIWVLGGENISELLLNDVWAID